MLQDQMKRENEARMEKERQEQEKREKMRYLQTTMSWLQLLNVQSLSTMGLVWNVHTCSCLKEICTKINDSSYNYIFFWIVALIYCLPYEFYRQEQERKRLAEMERQMEKQRQIEREREEQRQKMMEQREVIFLWKVLNLNRQSC